MDAENDNDQPNSSSASASASSSNNSSSSNLLGHLPMLPFMRSTDDDEQDEPDGNNVNDINEEPMPLQPPPSSSAAPPGAASSDESVPAQPASASLLQQLPTMAPNATTTTTAVTLTPSTSAAAAAAGGAVSTVEPMFHHQTSPQLPSVQSSSIDTSSSLLAHTFVALQERQTQLTAQTIRNEIAETIDASAVIVVQTLEANADENQLHHQSHLYPQAAEIGAGEAAAAAVNQNDIQLDDNDNNDFDVDLNLRNNDSIANASSSSSQQQQQQQQQSLNLDTSASGSAGPSNPSGRQVPLQPSTATTTLPLLLYQQQQPPLQQEQQTEESKHLPSYDHHYHNPREFHLHSHPYQHPCLYPYGFDSTAHQLSQKKSNGAPNNSSITSTIMFGNASSSSAGNQGLSTSALGVTAASTSPAVDRIKLLYPNVNENETPLPRCWSPHDKCLSIGLSQNNLRVHFKGVGKQNNDAASVRTAHPIPPACGIYYFEVKIISKGKNGYMGIGLTAQQFRMNRLPGWDKQSYGYHGDDGNSFSSSGHGQSYGPTFTTGDIIGCCVNFVNNTCFYTKNGIDLGIAFRDLPTKLYPTVGLQTPGEEVDANFGQEPFKFDQIEDLMQQMKSEMKATIYDFPLPTEQGDPTTLLQKMVNSYLVHNGYSQTAEVFARQKTGQNLREDISSIRNRQKILKLVMSGKMGQAIEQTVRSYPGLLENNKNLLFMLKCRQFIEMINGSDVEYCPSNSINKTTTTTQTILSAAAAANQTSVIQSTKSYQNGNGPNNGSNGSTTTNAITTTTTNHSSTTNSSSNTSTTTTTIATATVATSTAATETTNNAQNSSHTTVINTDNDIKNQSILVEHCSANDDAPTTISKSNNDYLNDVEMENNSHTTNGNVCKNGNTSNFNDSIDADEEMDVDILPSIRKYSHGIERILEFGKDLSQMGQQLEKENKMTDEERQMLEDAFSLIAYSNPWASPLGWQLCPTKRETVCRALNSAILESMSYAKWPPLEYCVAHANELLKVMAQASLGACAFVNITDVFPKN